MSRKRPQSAAGNEELIAAFYTILAATYGAQHWWPAESPLEMIVGAYLTQNTAWKNVELALANLRRAGTLNLSGLRAISIDELEQLVRPAGYFRQKAARLKTFVAHLDQNHGGSLDRMFARPTNELRSELLSLNGVGPETADSILLYAGGHEVFVVDAYTRRLLERHRIISSTASYDEVRTAIETSLSRGELLVPAIRKSDFPVPPVHQPSRLSQMPRSKLAQRYNEFHALIVQVGKHLCQSRQAKCHLCPLAQFLPAAGPKLPTKKTVRSRSR